VQPYIRKLNTWESMSVGGYPLGASGRSNYTSKTDTLPPGAMLLFLSDGVIEAQNVTGEFYGFDRFEALLASFPLKLTPEQVVDAVLRAVDEHVGAEEQQDDITVVVMQATPVAVAAMAR